jgi:hypothetical protein
MNARPRPGTQVTVTARESDPYILNFQRYAIVSRVTGLGIFVTLDATFPPNTEFGPFPPAQLQEGWRDENGRWR